LALFAAGLVIRLILARYSVGLGFDVRLFRQWSDRLVELGPGSFYAPEYFADYPPGYLYVLWVLGKASRVLLGGPPSIAVLKLPAIVADLGVAALAALLARRMTPPSWARRLPIPAMAAAAILLNPALILISAVWGQVDSVLALLVLAAIYALAGPPSVLREACGVGLLAVAVATKPQAVLALPVIAVLLAHRHIARDGVHPGAWARIAGHCGLLALLAVTVVAAMFAPFGIGPADIPGFYRRAGSVYPFTSLWAYNVWGAAGFYRPDIGSGAMRVGGVAAFYIGLVAFAAATIMLAVQGWRSLARRVDANAVALFGTVAVTCAGFALLTRSHERYLYLAAVGLAPFVGERSFRRALMILSICFLLNVHFVYVFFSQNSLPPRGAWTIQPIFDALFGSGRDALQLKALSMITATACLGVAFLGWRWLDHRVAPSSLT
jgi:hypothetical protein